MLKQRYKVLEIEKTFSRSGSDASHGVTMAPRMKLCDWLWLLIVVLLAGSGTVLAQFSGSIQGVVLDPSGAAVAAAKITLINRAIGVTSNAVSDASGNYRFISIAPGAYQ